MELKNEDLIDKTCPIGYRIPVVLVGTTRMIECPRPKQHGYMLLTACKRCKYFNGMSSILDKYNLVIEGIVCCLYRTLHQGKQKEN